MEQLSYSFITTMLHSLWQSALLLLMYAMLTAANKRQTPLAKRNLLFALLGFQILASASTFYIIYASPFNGQLQNFIPSFNETLQFNWMQAYAPLFFWAYIIVLSIQLSRAFFNWTQFTQQYKTALQKASIDIRLFTKTKALQFGIQKKVFIYCSSNISTAMTFGFWKPVILLPLALVNQLSIKETEALIIHELSHIKNNDYGLNWLLVITESAFFFNPFIKIIAQKIKVEREKNCDVQVLHFSYPHIIYAETLLKTAQFQQNKLSLQMAAVNHKKHLLQRIQFFTQHSNLEFKKTKPFLTALPLLAILILNIFLASVFVQKNNPEFVPAFLPYASELNGYKTEMNKNISSSPVVAIIPALANNEKKDKKVSSTLVKEKKVQKVQPMLYDDYADGAADFIPVIPVSTLDSETKEMIINEESAANGKKITTTYKAILINGQWVLEPLWMMTETKPLKKDSLNIEIKDDVIRIIPAVQ